MSILNICLSNPHTAEWLFVPLFHNYLHSFQFQITYLKRWPEDSGPFNFGYCKNCFVFCCYCSIQNWEKYVKSLSWLRTLMNMNDLLQSIKSILFYYFNLLFPSEKGVLKFTEEGSFSGYHGKVFRFLLFVPVLNQIFTYCVIF